MDGNRQACLEAICEQWIWKSYGSLRNQRRKSCHSPPLPPARLPALVQTSSGLNPRSKGRTQRAQSRVTGARMEGLNLHLHQHRGTCVPPGAGTWLWSSSHLNQDLFLWLPEVKHMQCLRCAKGNRHSILVHLTVRYYCYAYFKWQR